jgi:hypothetical protein
MRAGPAKLEKCLLMIKARLPTETAVAIEFFFESREDCPPIGRKIVLRGLGRNAGNLKKMSSQTSITQLLVEAGDGEQTAMEALLPLVYQELRKLAEHYLRRERAEHTLQATALVHEAYLRLIDQTGISWQNRAHFFSVAAQVMRHILVDHARAHNTEERGGGLTKLSLDDAVSFFEDRDVNLGRRAKLA